MNHSPSYSLNSDDDPESAKRTPATGGAAGGATSPPTPAQPPLPRKRSLGAAGTGSISRTTVESVDLPPKKASRQATD